MRLINEIVVHCSATPPKWMAGEGVVAKRDAIRQWHRDKGWRDIGYHFVIDVDGTIAPGRDVSDIGAHVQGRNAHTVGVCLIGGLGSKPRDPFTKHFTPKQDRALRKLIDRLKAEIPEIVRVTGHNEYANKACPGFRVPVWLAQSPPADVTQRHEPAEHWLVALLRAILSLFRGK